MAGSARRLAAIAMLGTGLLLAAACAEIPPPELGAEITVRPGGFDTDETPEVTTAGSAGEADEPIAVLPPRDPDYVPTLIVGGPSGIRQGTVEGLEPMANILGQEPVTRVVDDLFGGLVISDPDGAVSWYPAEGTEPTMIAGPGDRLLDVGYLDNTAEALVADGDGAVQRIRLLDGERSQLTTVPEGEQLLSFSAAGGLYALSVTDADCGTVRFLNSTGDDVRITGPAAVDCPVPRRMTYPLVALSSDGDALAFTEVNYRSDGVEAETTLIGRELSSSVELFRLTIGAAGDRITSLAFDGRRVVFLRTTLGGETSLVVLEAVSDGIPPEQVIDFPVSSPTSVTFARLPLTVGLPGPDNEG